MCYLEYYCTLVLFLLLFTWRSPFEHERVEMRQRFYTKILRVMFCYFNYMHVIQLGTLEGRLQIGFGNILWGNSRWTRDNNRTTNSQCKRFNIWKELKAYNTFSFQGENSVHLQNVEVTNAERTKRRTTKRRMGHIAE